MSSSHHLIIIFFKLFLAFITFCSADYIKKCTGRERFFMQLGYPNDEKPKPAFSLFEKQAISDRCFQFNASSGFIILNAGKEKNEKMINFTSDCTNIIDDTSSCNFNDGEKKMKIQFTPKSIDSNFKVVIQLEVGFTNKLGRVYQSVAKNVSIKV